MTGIRAAMALLTLPGFLLHELTHAVVAAPWARRVAVSLDLRTGHPRARIDWRCDDPPKAASAIAPFAIGMAAMVGFFLLWVSAGMPMTSGVQQFAAVVVGIMQWIIYTTPSGEDLSYVRGDQ